MESLGILWVVWNNSQVNPRTAWYKFICFYTPRNSLKNSPPPPRKKEGNTMEINLNNTDTYTMGNAESLLASSVIYSLTSVPTVVSSPNAVPEYKTSGSAGADLKVMVPVVLKPHHTLVVPTGVRLAIPEGYVGLVFPRSGLASKGVTLANSVGVIDSDYRGEIQVALVNHGYETVRLNPGDRVAQIAFFPVYQFPFTLTQTLDTTARGNGGFGSTGV
jgi:dUTP pyrophosphatase